MEAQKVANAEHAKDPFVSPPRLAELDSMAYAKFEDEYAEKRDATHCFARRDETFTGQYLDREPSVFYPAASVCS